MDKLELTSEQIAQYYSAAMISVNLINSIKPDFFTEESWVEFIQENKKRLNRVLLTIPWTTEDLIPLQLASI